MENGCCFFYIQIYLVVNKSNHTVHKISTIHFVNYATMSFTFLYCSKLFAKVKKQKIRVFNIHYQDFLVIQNVYDFFLHKVLLAMDGYKENISLNKT